MKKCICWCLSVIELKNARWNIEISRMNIFPDNSLSSRGNKIFHTTQICYNPPLQSCTGDKTWPILDRLTLIGVRFSLKYTNKQNYCGHNILTEDGFVIQMFSNAGVPGWRIAWVKTNCFIISDMLCKFILVITLLPMFGPANLHTYIA